MLPVFTNGEAAKTNIIKGPDSWFSRVLRPAEEELEAQKNGQRWTWALENRFIPPGSKFEQTVMNGVDRENKWLAQLLRQQHGTDVSPIATERQRSNMMNMWKQYLRDIENGHFDAYGGTAETAQQWANAFRQRYDSLFGQGANIDLAPVAETTGKRADIQRKQFVDARRVLSDTETVDNKIREWVDNGDFKNPTKSRLIKNELDKIAQSLSSTLGGDSKNMADAEKIRIQILYLPESAQDRVRETIRRYRNALTGIMNSASAKEWSQSNRGKVKEMQAALGTVPNVTGNEDRGSLGDMAATMGTFVSKALSDKSELPHDVATDLQAAKNLYESYMQNMVLAANVDPAVAHHMATYLHNQFRNYYNAEVQYARRPGDAWQNTLQEMDYAKLAQEVPADPLLEPPVFIAPRTEVPVTGTKPTTAPQSRGETQPTQAPTTIPGVGVNLDLSRYQ